MPSSRPAGRRDRRRLAPRLIFELASSPLVRRADAVRLAAIASIGPAGRGGGAASRRGCPGRIGGPRRVVVRLEQQPVLLLLARLGLHAHKVPAALAASRRSSVNLRCPCDSRTAGSPSGVQVPWSQTIIVPPPYSPFGMTPSKLAVVERVVLGVHREPLLAGIEARALRHRPALQHAVELEPEIIVQAPRGVLLHDEANCRSLRRARPGGSGVLAKSRLAL